MIIWGHLNHGRDPAVAEESDVHGGVAVRELSAARAEAHGDDVAPLRLVGADLSHD